MAYLFFGLIAICGASLLLSVLIVCYTRGLDSSEDGHTRAEEREERWYPLG